MGKFKFFVFYSHFVFFVLQQLRLPSSVIEFFKLLIGVNYLMAFLVLIVFFKVKILFWELIFIVFSCVFIFSKLIILDSINVAFIYWILAYLCIVKFRWSKEDLIKLINQVALIYFCISVLLRFTSLNSYFGYENRELENRFLFSINRFLGVEGSPAGPDIFYTLVVLFNIYFYGVKKSLGKVGFWLGIIVILWTASLSNLAALALASIIYVFYKLRVLAFISIILAPYISTKLILEFPDKFEVLLNVLTTLRANIWLQVIESMSLLNSVEEWFLGQNELYKFIGYGGEDANPHNLTLFAVQFLGVPLCVFIFILLLRYIFRVKKGFYFLVITFIFCYSISNAMPFTTRGNPIVIYLLFAIISMGSSEYVLKKKD